jgi:hypothetical protein
MFRDRPCTKYKTMIKGNEKNCPRCGLRVGRENINPEFPGSYKGYSKTVFIQ